MVTTVSPKASETPTNPMPTFGMPAAITAAPQPPNTSHNVPTHSAMARLAVVIRKPSAILSSPFRARVCPRGSHAPLLCSPRQAPCLPLPSVFVVRDVQERTAGLAVDGVDIVCAEAAARAAEAHFV